MQDLLVYWILKLHLQCVVLNHSKYLTSIFLSNFTKKWRDIIQNGE